MSLAGAPILVAPNLIRHFYPGGGAVAAFRGLEPGPHPSPEDWVASTTSRFADAPTGLSRLADGSTLDAAVAADPLGFLGPEHLGAFGTDTCLLVKLLESAERLIVHCHPDRRFAARHLGCAHGKTEAWIVLSEGPGEVFLGFRRPLDEAELAAWVAEQRLEEMLGALNRLEVRRGAAVLVPAGVPHAIGAGVLVVELQEPTDFSIALEQRGLASPELGLGWALALGAVDRSAWDPTRLARLSGPGLGAAGRVLPEAADPFFRAELALGTAELAPGLAVLVVLGGDARLVAASATLELTAGATVLLPYGAGPARLEGGAAVLVCRPPLPGPLEPARPLL